MISKRKFPLHFKETGKYFLDFFFYPITHIHAEYNLKIHKKIFPIFH
uniref:Uncharacterized protein n=1 Tax=Anguilla anguilla TaxID=7936 RepID=A0A0E9WE52_ANGAN